MQSIFTTTLLSLSLLLPLSSGHSWLECSDLTVYNMDALKSGDKSVYPNWACHGYPRNKIYNGDWIAESSNYLWDLSGRKAREEAVAKGTKFACNPLQRKAVYPSNVPAAQAHPGQTLLLRFWGNGHTSWRYGAPIHHDPGLVRVYSAGKDGSFDTVQDITPDKMIAESNFSANAISYQRPDGGPDDRVNWMNLYIPSHWSKGRYAMIWTWANYWDPFLNNWRDVYTTCFDIYVNGPEASGNPPTPPPPTNAQKSNQNTGKANQKCNDPCLRGGIPTAKCTNGVNCPPCRYYANGEQTCFEYLPNQNGVCPFGNAFDCKKNRFE